MSKKIKSLLEKYNINKTQNRIEIIKIFLKEPLFLSVTDVAKNMPKASLKSIYQSIKLFLKKNIINSYSLRGRTKYFLNSQIRGYKGIHLINENGKAQFLEVDTSIFKKIQRSVASVRKCEIKSVKIIVDVKDLES